MEYTATFYSRLEVGMHVGQIWHDEELGDISAYVGIVRRVAWDAETRDFVYEIETPALGLVEIAERGSRLYPAKPPQSLSEPL